MRIFHKHIWQIDKNYYAGEVFSKVESFLKENNLSYQNILFAFEEIIFGDETKTSIYKISKKHPCLEKYKTLCPGDYSLSLKMSNCDENWKHHDNDDVSSAIREIASKIPRPYNMYDCKIVFNNVNFFNRISPQMFFDDSTFAGKWSFPQSAPLSSNIMIYRNSVTPKQMSLEVTLDVTGINDIATKESFYLKTITDYFTSKYHVMVEIIQFDESEAKEYARIKLKTATIVDAAQKACETWEGSSLKLNWSGWDDLRHNKHSLVKALKQQIKIYGYKYISYEHYCYKVTKNDVLNHTIEVLLVSAPMCRRIDTMISYKGTGFEYSFEMPSFTPNNQLQADKYIESLMQVLNNIEEKYLVRIGSEYLS